MVGINSRTRYCKTSSDYDTPQRFYWRRTGQNREGVFATKQPTDGTCTTYRVYYTDVRRRPAGRSRSNQNVEGGRQEGQNMEI